MGNEWGEFNMSHRNKVNEILNLNLSHYILNKIIATGENVLESPVTARAFISNKKLFGYDWQTGKTL